MDNTKLPTKINVFFGHGGEDGNYYRLPPNVTVILSGVPDLTSINTPIQTELLLSILLSKKYIEVNDNDLKWLLTTSTFARN